MKKETVAWADRYTVGKRVDRKICEVHTVDLPRVAGIVYTMSPGLVVSKKLLHDPTGHMNQTSPRQLPTPRVSRSLGSRPFRSDPRNFVKLNTKYSFLWLGIRRTRRKYLPAVKQVRRIFCSGRQTYSRIADVCTQQKRWPHSMDLP